MSRPAPLAEDVRSARPRAVLVCQTCPYVWEPSNMGADDFAALVQFGCPDCGGWVWLGELLEVGAPA
jgi:hypothetical protein